MQTRKPPRRTVASTGMHGVFSAFLVFTLAAVAVAAIMLISGVSLVIFPQVPGSAKKTENAAAAAAAGGSGNVGGNGGGFPFLSDFDLSKPIVGGPTKKKLTAEEEDYQQGEAAYQMHLAKRSELMGGRNPTPPYRGWNAGKVKEILLAPTYPCRRQQRLSKRGDASRWLCNVDKLRRNKHPVVYSIGSVTLEFERAVHRSFRATSFVLNPFLEGPVLQQAQSEPFVSFLPVGVGASGQLKGLRKAAPEKEFSTLHAIMGRLNHTRVDVLKIDCERCEEALIPEMVNVFGRERPPAWQVILDIHQIRHVGRTSAVIFALESMGYRLFQSEPTVTCQTCYHLSFVHEQFVDPRVAYPLVSSA